MDNLIHVAGTFLWNNDKFLILKRHPAKSQGNTWGLPAGKVDTGETVTEAARRELFEESGCDVPLEHFTQVLQMEDSPRPGESFLFFAFEAKVDGPVLVQISATEHIEYLWVTPEECYNRTDLIHGLHTVLELVGYIK